jgi:mono/diheme cytochrome c family protein
MHSAQEWPEVFQRMLMRMQMMSGGMMMGNMMRIKAPTSQEETTLLAYLNRHSLHAADQQTLSDLNSPSGMLFRQACSQCHALPDPKQHTPQEWPDVVARMKQNMQLMKLPLIQPKEEALIVQFLQQAASQ